MSIGIHLTKRRVPRAPIAAPAEVAAGLARYSATVSQIGEGGLRLESERELPRSRLVVAFELPGFGAQRVLSEVCWQSARAYGCVFKELPAATQLCITNYVKKMKHSCSQLQFALALNKPRPEWERLAREVGLQPHSSVADIKRFLARAMEQLQSAAR